MSRQHRYGAVGANTRSGFTLLIAVLVVGIVLAIGLSILTITLKEYTLSGVARESVIALNAADAGMECVFYWDHHPSDGDQFDGGGGSITCMGTTVSVPSAGSGAPQRFQFRWGMSPDPVVCAKISVTKYFNAITPVPMGFDGAGNPISCPAGVECTLAESRGYNKACSQIGTDPRTVERALRARF